MSQNLVKMPFSVIITFTKKTELIIYGISHYSINDNFVTISSGFVRYTLPMRNILYIEADYND